MFLRRAGAAQAGLRPVRIAPQTSNSRFDSTDGGTARGLQNDTFTCECKGMLSNLLSREASYHIDFMPFTSRNAGLVEKSSPSFNGWRLDLRSCETNTTLVEETSFSRSLTVPRSSDGRIHSRPALKKRYYSSLQVIGLLRAWVERSNDPEQHCRNRSRGRDR